MGFGDHLKELRKARKISQAELAKLSGLSQSAISAIEQGVNEPTSVSVQQLAKALGMKPGELLGEADSGGFTAEELQLISAYRTLTAQGREYIRQQIYVATKLYSGGAGVPVVENRKEG